jgi:hypothetical protein
MNFEGNGDGMRATGLAEGFSATFERVGFSFYWDVAYEPGAVTWSAFGRARTLEDTKKAMEEAYMRLQLVKAMLTGART